MAEQITLTTPVPAPTRTGYHVKRLDLDWDDARIYVELRGNDGQILAHSYEGAEATSLMVTLNKANLTANTLQKRIFTKLIADGVLVGSITGSPD